MMDSSLADQVTDNSIPKPQIYVNLIQACEHLKKEGEFSTCFTELQRAFLRQRPTKLKSLIRLVKHWYQTVWLSVQGPDRRPEQRRGGGEEEEAAGEKERKGRVDDKVEGDEAEGGIEEGGGECTGTRREKLRGRERGEVEGRRGGRRGEGQVPVGPGYLGPLVFPVSGNGNCILPGTLARTMGLS